MPTAPHYTSDAELEAIFHGVLTCTLPKPAWTHAAHFAVALWVVARRPQTDVPRMIRAYNEATGVPNTDTGGYHHTITLASLQAASRFHAAHAGQPLFATCNAVLASPLGHPDWILAHWSPDRLFTPHARRCWSPPDLLPIEF